MSTIDEETCPLEAIYEKLQAVVDIAEKMTKNVRETTQPNLAHLAADLKYLRFLREVWVGNVDHYSGELESAIVDAITRNGDVRA